MKKLAIFMVLTTLFMFALAPQVRANNVCSVADLKGDYSFVVSGTLNESSGLPAGPFAAAGKTTYHGDGIADGVIQISLNGKQISSNWSATYAADSSNCTFTKAITLDVGGTLHFFITVGDDFRELRFVGTDTGTAITGTARKQ